VKKMRKQEEKARLSLVLGRRWTGFGHKRETWVKASVEYASVLRTQCEAVTPLNMGRMQGIQFRRYLQVVSRSRHRSFHLRPLLVAQYEIFFSSPSCPAFFFSVNER